MKTIDDCNILQNDLNMLSQWTNDWLLSFNVDKCKVMHIGKDNPKLDYTMRTENENRILIETSEEKDLGVWITNDLKHEKQVIAASQRAMAVLRSVRKAFVRFDIEIFQYYLQCKLHIIYQTAFGILYSSLVTILCKRYIIVTESSKKRNQTGVGTKRVIV